uniref:Uncharacterized protein n=1 Tax=Lactiplantibacillus plantarum TaxID=1590 RepID=D3K3V4_LACPN|nr:hypothetical protein [Lactiplantibacillus plantarum]
MRTYTPQLKLMVFVLNFLYQKSASRQQKKVLELSTHFLFTNQSCISPVSLSMSPLPYLRS